MAVFRANKRAAEQIRQSREYRDTLEDAAKAVASRADTFARQAGAPWVPRKSHDVIEVQTEGDNVYVVNTDHAGHLQEFGSKNNPPHAPLRRAVRAAGLKLDENPK